jgi:hypothetical protein
LKFIEVEYNCELKPLESVLAGVARPGNFYVSGAVEVPMPQVSIEDFGMLSFPVPDQQIAVLLHHAERAPYDRGAQTILDTSVRCVWQIAAGKVRIAGKSWPANFASILSNVAAGLGCEGATVRAELYKLLVYDRDGFFLPHRDTEKTDGMFGTLVLTLPSPHRGGELRIRHGGRDVTVDTSSVDLSEIAYVAFYADCEHEALPVREGNRVCLVYKLVQKLEDAEQNTLGAPQYASEIAETAAILDRFLSGPEAPAKIAWLLDHQYSPAGLGFAALKGADAAKAEVLREAAARARCAAHLGIVHIGESGSAEPVYVSYRSRRDRYRNSGNSEEGADFTVVTVDDAWQYVDEWRDVKDRGVEFGPIPLASGELLPEGALDKEPPDKKRLTEASGNEGASYERSYHRAALVLWRQDRYAEVLLQAGVAAALPCLKELTTGGPRLEALTLARRIVEAWPADARRWNSYVRGGGRPGADHRIAMVTALATLEAGDLLERFIAETVTPRYDGSENAALLSATAVLDDTRAAAALSALVAARMPAQPKACAELLWGLAAETLRPFPEVAEAAVAALDGIGAQDAANPPSSWVAPGREPSLGPEFLVRLFDALRRFPNRGFLEGAVEKTSGRPEVFRPATLVVPPSSKSMPHGDPRPTIPKPLSRACGLTLPTFCLGAARRRPGRLRTGGSKSSSPAPARIAGNCRPSLSTRPRRSTGSGSGRTAGSTSTA